MNDYCLREGRFSQPEQALIRTILEKPEQGEIRRWWEDRLAAKGALQLEGNPYLDEIEAEVLLLCNDDDPLIPPSETLRIYESLRNSNLYVQESDGHLTFERGESLGLLRLLSRIMQLREEASDAQA